MWDAVKWTRAGQIARLFKLSEPAAELLVDEDPPEAYFARLRGADALDDAMAFLAFALPRRLAIAWCRDCVGSTAGAMQLSPEDAAAFSAANAWLEDPSDERRWTAHEAARAAEFRSAEAVLALAVYASGGSMAPPGSAEPPALPPPDLAARLVSGAVIMAACRVPFERMRGTKAAFLDNGAIYAAG
jgi:hypothetical protein